MKVEGKCGQNKVMMCSRYGNGGRMHVRLNGEPLEEVNCFKNLGSQVTADGGCAMDHSLPSFHFSPFLVIIIIIKITPKPRGVSPTTVLG